MDTPAECTIETHLDERTLLRGLNRYWFRRYSANTAVKTVMLLFALVLPFSTLDRWVVAVFYAVFVFSIAQYIVVYIRFRRRSLQIHRDRGDPHMRYQFSDQGIHVAGGDGSADLHWSAFTDLWQYDDMWMLIQRRVTFHILPTADLTDEARAIITRCLQRG